MTNLDFPASWRSPEQPPIPSGTLVAEVEEYGESGGGLAMTLPVVGFDSAHEALTLPGYLIALQLEDAPDDIPMSPVGPSSLNASWEISPTALVRVRDVMLAWEKRRSRYTTVVEFRYMA